MSLKSVKTLTASQIAKKWKLSQKTVNSLIDDGSKVEHEHDKDMNNAKQIARDHIAERPDYYKKLRKMEKSKISMKEESVTGGVSGLGYVTGSPAVSTNSYADTNAMSYVDENGNQLEWIRNHTKGHNVVGFKEFKPTDLTKVTKKKIHEGMSAGPERESDYSIGDSTGSSRKVMKVDEVNLSKIKNIASKVPPRVKSAAKVGMALANMTTLGQVAGDAAEGRKGADPKRGLVAATSTLPGPIGYGAMGLNYTIKGFDKAREHIKSKQKAKMEEQGSPANPARYTERPMYEKNGNNLSSGEVERGIYESPRVKFVSKQNPADLPPRPADYKPGDFGSKLAREGGIKYPGKKKPSRPIKEEQIDEISAELVGKVSNARFWRKETPSKTLTRAINKKFIEAGKPLSKKDKNLKKEDIADKDWDDTTGKKLPENHNKPDTSYAPGATGTTKTIYEVTTMDTKELINEALDDILENNLVSMKENLMTALQEKAMEKIEEKKKEIAANYFAQ